MRNAFSGTVLASALLMGCGVSVINPGEASKTNPNSEEINGYVAGLGQVESDPEQPKTEVPCTDCPVAGQEGESFCTYSRYTETAQYDKLVAFQPNSATLWPGVVVQGKDAKMGVLTPIGVGLAPVTFSVSLENISGSPVGKMPSPSLSSFRDERNRILYDDVTGATPAAMSFATSEVHSKTHLYALLGGAADLPGVAGISASFDFSKTKTNTKILVNYSQAYYTIDVDTPQEPKDFFDTNVTVDELREMSGSGNPPLYVQSITYGRRVIFAVESAENNQVVSAALNAAFQGAKSISATPPANQPASDGAGGADDNGGSGAESGDDADSDSDSDSDSGKVATASGSVDGKPYSVNIEAKYEKTLNNSTIRAFVIGGSGGEAAAVLNGFDGLVSYIVSGGDYNKQSPGAPISYKLAHLNNSVAKFSFGTEFVERVCTQNRGTLRVELVSIAHIDGYDSGKNVEFFGDVSLRYPTDENGVESCEMGGQMGNLWHMDDGSWVEIPKKSTWYPSNPQTKLWDNVTFGPSQTLCIQASLTEYDPIGNDDFGSDQILINFDSGWSGEHVLHLSGKKNQSAEITVRISME
jgi:thiol-activated cytolysin